MDLEQEHTKAHCCRVENQNSFPDVKAELALAESMAGLALAPLQLSKDAGTARNLEDATWIFWTRPIAKSFPQADESSNSGLSATDIDQLHRD